MLVMREAVLQSKIMAVLNHPDAPCRVFRNNVGMLRDARGVPVRYGLAKGSSDLIGLVIPTGQFLAVEVKTPTGRVRTDQEQWMEVIRKLGGLAFVMRSVEQAEALVKSLRSEGTA